MDQDDFVEIGKKHHVFFWTVIEICILGIIFGILAAIFDLLIFKIIVESFLMLAILIFGLFFFALIISGLVTWLLI